MVAEKKKIMSTIATHLVSGSFRFGETSDSAIRKNSPVFQILQNASDFVDLYTSNRSKKIQRQAGVLNNSGKYTRGVLLSYQTALMHRPVFSSE